MPVLITLLLLALFASGPLSAQINGFEHDRALSTSTTRVALLIANSNHKYLPHLKHPIDDAQQFALALSSLGFQVYLATDLSAKEQRLAFNHYAKAAQNTDISLVYFAGYSQIVEGKDIIYAADARPTVRPLNAGIGVDSLMQKLADPSRINIFFIDAYRASEPLEHNSYNLQIMREIPNNSALIFADSQKQMADTGINAQHNTFIGALLDQIIAPNHAFSKILENIKRETIKHSNGRQNLHIQSNLQADPILRPIAQFTNYLGQQYSPKLRFAPHIEDIGFAHKPILLDIANPAMTGSFLGLPNNF